VILALLKHKHNLNLQKVFHMPTLMRGLFTTHCSLLTLKQEKGIRTIDNNITVGNVLIMYLIWL